MTDRNAALQEEAALDEWRDALRVGPDDSRRWDALASEYRLLRDAYAEARTDAMLREDAAGNERAVVARYVQRTDPDVSRLHAKSCLCTEAANLGRVQRSVDGTADHRALITADLVWQSDQLAVSFSEAMNSHSPMQQRAAFRAVARDVLLSGSPSALELFLRNVPRSEIRPGSGGPTMSEDAFAELSMLESIDAVLTEAHVLMHVDARSRFDLHVAVADRLRENPAVTMREPRAVNAYVDALQRVARVATGLDEPIHGAVSKYASRLAEVLTLQQSAARDLMMARG